MLLLVASNPIRFSHKKSYDNDNFHYTIQHTVTYYKYYVRRYIVENA